MAGGFTVRLKDEALEALDRLAEKTERPRNWLVNRAVEDYVALNEWQIGKIEAGLKQAVRGEFASDKEMARIRQKYAGRK